MECKQVELLLTDYAEGELSLEMNEFLADHLNNCPHCREEYEELKGIIQEIHLLSERVEPSSEHKAILRDSLLREQRIFMTSSPFLSALHRKNEELKKRFREERKNRTGEA